MKIAKNVLKWILYILLIPILFLAITFILSAITIERETEVVSPEKSFYLSTNGVHLNIIIPKKELDSLFLAGINHKEREDYLAFGWGDKDFYLKTETWDDLTFSRALKAMFIKTSSLMHVTRYERKYTDWVKVNVNDNELNTLKDFILRTFKTDESGMKIKLKTKGYTTKDDFYKAKGNYTLFKNCNSWVNQAFKESGLKSCLWTPFDFGLLNKYE